MFGLQQLTVLVLTAGGALAGHPVWRRTNELQPRADRLQPHSDRLQPRSDWMQSRADLLRRQTTVLPELAGHGALRHLDLQFCGSGSESQISRGPLGCGFPVVGDHPWLVALGFAPPGGATRYICSGALINDQHVLTSARCALGAAGFRLQSALVGEYDLSSRRDCLWYDPSLCTERQPVAVSRVAVHPSFVRRQAGASRFDLALVQLARPVTLRHGVQPICLPMFPLRHPPHRQFALTFGLNSGPAPAADSAATCCSCDRDRSATSHVMDHEQLSLANSSYSGPDTCRYRLLPEVAGGRRRCLGSGTPCMADLGSPLVAADRFGSAYFLLGVASVRPTQKHCRAPGVSVTYAPVRPHLRWILDRLQQMSDDFSSRRTQRDSAV